MKPIGDLLPDPPPEGDTLNVHQRLAAVIKASGAIPKTGKAPAATGGYAFHQVDDVVAHLRPLLLELGVLPLVSVEEMEIREVQVTRKGGYQAIERHAVTKISVVFVNVEDPKDRTEPVFSYGDGIDGSDKSSGKAISYALKNSLLANFQLRGQPDNEAGAHEETPVRQQKSPQKPSAPPRSDERPPAPAPPAESGRTTVQQLKDRADPDLLYEAVKRRQLGLSEAVDALWSKNKSDEAWGLISRAVAVGVKNPKIKKQSGPQRNRLYLQLASEIGVDRDEARELLRDDFSRHCGGVPLDDAPWTVHAALYVVYGGAPEAGK